MATSLDTLSLSQMLDLAIEMPQKGSVHFAAMKKLLQAVLEHLDVQYLTSQEPWTGQLSGPSLADVATHMEKMKKEMEDCKKQMSELVHEVIVGIQAEVSHLSEDVRKMQKAQSCMSEEIKKIQEEDMTLIQDLREEVDRIKTTQIRMEGDVKKLKETPALIKKMGEDLQKLREDAAKWKEESSKEISQQIEALRQETKRELQMMEEQQEMRYTMLEQVVIETINKVNEQLGDTGETGDLEDEQQEGNGDCSSCTFNIRVCLGKLLRRCEKLQEQVESMESRQMAMGKCNKMMRKYVQEREQDQKRLHYVEATVVQMKGDCEKLSFVSGTLQKDSQQKQKEIEMLFQSLEKLQKEKADQQDMLAAMDMVQSREASVPAQGFLDRVTNASCPWGMGGRTGVGRENFLSSGGPSPSRWWDQAHQADGANGATAA
ncbi:glutamine-rich protein 2-like [Passer domesticus]|uniref:glutamine-rich protein 2-like n=1 Tax=Passer domesticus TaxID=48849 RepID=UPI0030FED2EA